MYIEGRDEAIDLEMQTYHEADLVNRIRRNHTQLDLLTMVMSISVQCFTYRFLFL